MKFFPMLKIKTISMHADTKHRMTSTSHILLDKRQTKRQNKNRMHERRRTQMRGSRDLILSRIQRAQAMQQRKQEIKTQKFPNSKLNFHVYVQAAVWAFRKRTLNKSTPLLHNPASQMDALFFLFVPSYSHLLRLLLRPLHSHLWKSTSFTSPPCLVSTAHPHTHTKQPNTIPSVLTQSSPLAEILSPHVFPPRRLTCESNAKMRVEVSAPDPMLPSCLIRKPFSLLPP